MKKILLIEDNKDIAQNISEYLEIQWFQVDVCYDGETWLEQAFAEKYDLLLLDLTLPHIPGLTIAKKVSQKRDIPILMTTARGSIDDKLEWFESGAIDYLVKPFDLRELFARMQAIMKQQGQGSTSLSDEKFILWEVEIDLKKRKFFKNSVEISVTQKEFSILEFLLLRKWSAVSRSQLIESVWWESGLFDSDRKLDVYISNIRSKFGKKFIKTIKWFGYEIS